MMKVSPPSNPMYILMIKFTPRERWFLFLELLTPIEKQEKKWIFFPTLTRQNADGYFIMFDRANTLGGEPLPVGRVGWKYLPEHKLYLTTGIKIIDMYRGLGLSRSLWEKKRFFNY